MILISENNCNSFVSRQLHKYLLSVENEIEEATGTTKLGAVLFADASGFTAMTQRLARQVFIIVRIAPLIYIVLEILDFVSIFALIVWGHLS